jgi:hypothetical protein
MLSRLSGAPQQTWLLCTEGFECQGQKSAFSDCFHKGQRSAQIYYGPDFEFLRILRPPTKLDFQNSHDKSAKPGESL